MPEFERYALYFSPDPASELGRFGNSWLGHNPYIGDEITRPKIKGISAEELEQITIAPKHYGFHATLKAPFELADGYQYSDLLAAIRSMTKRQKPFSLRGLKIQNIGKFLALTLIDKSIELEMLAAASVRELDVLRAPLSDAKINKRRESGLSNRQDELMLRWGYPYVLDEYKFHLTLTGSIGKENCNRIFRLIEPMLSPFIGDNCKVDNVALFGDPGRAQKFQLLERFSLDGH